MRILHVIGVMGYGGAELLTLELSSRFRERSIEVTVAVIGHCEEELVTRLRQAGVGLIRFQAALMSPLNLTRLLGTIRSGRYDIVHAHLFPAVYWVALCTLFVSAPVCWVYTEHSTHNRRRRNRWLLALERWAYGRYLGIFCVSAEVQASLARWLPHLSHVETINNGIDVMRFARAVPTPREQLQVTEEDIVIVMAGAFRLEKNHATLVRSIEFLPARYKLVLAGDGPEMAKVQLLARQAGVAERVRFLGTVGNVASLLKAADVYVLPSLFEGLPLSPIEAAAAGLPLVYSDVDGLRTLLAGTGVPVDPTDPRSIAEGILEATQDEGLRLSLVQKSRAFARQFDLRATAEHYERTYREWLDAPVAIHATSEFRP